MPVAHIRDTFVHIDVIRDDTNKIIHILDLDCDGPSVTNSIEDIQPDILKNLDIPGEVQAWTWFLYGTDGVVTQYDGSFKPIKSDDERVAKSFVERIQDRLYVYHFPRN